MYCSRCGQSLESTDAFCRNCGVPNPMAAPKTAAAEPAKPEAEPVGGDTAQEQAYTRPDYNPSQHARPSAGTTGGAARSGNNQPGVTGSIIFSVINIVAFGFGASMILGIIALIITLNANNQLTGEALAAKLHTARTLNIIGIAIVLLQVIVIISVIIFAALGTMMWGVWR